MKKFLFFKGFRKIEKEFNDYNCIIVETMPLVEPNWFSEVYPKPPAFRGVEFQLNKRSTCKERNLWKIEVPKIRERAIVVYPGDFFHDLGNNTFKLFEPFQVIEEEICYYEQDFVRELNNFLNDFYVTEAKKIKFDGFTIVESVNKYWWYNFIDEMDIIILFKRYTSRGNINVLLHPLQDVIRVPKQYMGLVIGKKGENIQFLKRKYKRNFQLEEL